MHVPWYPNITVAVPVQNLGIPNALALKPQLGKSALDDVESVVAAIPCLLDPSLPQIPPADQALYGIEPGWKGLLKPQSVAFANPDGSTLPTGLPST